MKRVFLGINLPENLKLKIEDFKLKSHLSSLPIKLVEPENSHINIKFLDKLNDEQIEQIKQTTNRIIDDFKPVKLKIKNCVIFPNPDHPKVLSLKVVSNELERIGNKIISELDKLPFVKTENRKHTPHITLGRIKENLSTAEKQLINNLQFSDEFNVNEIHMFESQLCGNGPIYKILNTLSF